MVSAFGCVLTHNLLRRTFAKDGARESSVKKKGVEELLVQSTSYVCLVAVPSWRFLRCRSCGGLSAVGHVAVSPL